MKLLGFFHTEKPKKNFFEQPNNQKPKTKKLNKSHFQGFVNSQYSIIAFGYVDFYAKIFLILYTPFKNSSTRIAIPSKGSIIPIIASVTLLGPI